MARRPSRKVLLAVVLALVAAGAATEGIFRAAIFSDGFWREALPRLRRPKLYASAILDDDYWKLQVTLLDPDRLRDIPRPDPQLGWVGERVEPRTYEVEPFGAVEGKRKVLLYGDSFAACARGMPREECFEGLLASSKRGRRHTLLNFGAHGYGLDQIYLLLRSTLGDHAEDDPIVVVAVLVDDDLDRVVLSFRGWPKARLRWEDGELVSGPPIPASTLDYLADHPVSIRSYAWRYLLHGSGLTPRSWAHTLSGYEPIKREKEELSRHILDAIDAELRAHDVEAFFLFFHGPRALRAKGLHTWREELLVDFCEERGWPFVSSRTDLAADVLATGRPGSDYYVLEGTEARHLNALGNEVVFRGLLRGLGGRFDPPPEDR